MERKQEDKPPEEPEELLKEFEWAKDHIPDDEVPQPESDEFEKVWKRIQEE